MRKTEAGLIQGPAVLKRAERELENRLAPGRRGIVRSDGQCALEIVQCLVVMPEALRGIAGIDVGVDIIRPAHDGIEKVIERLGGPE